MMKTLIGTLIAAAGLATCSADAARAPEAVLEQAVYAVCGVPSGSLECTVHSFTPPPLSMGVGEELLAHLESQNVGATAWAVFKDTIPYAGWAGLGVQSNSSQPTMWQAYGAGVVEGYITSTRIYQNVINICVDTVLPEELQTFVSTNQAWMRSNAGMSTGGPSPTTPHGLSTYWQHVAATLNQWEGMVAGYNMALTADPTGKAPLTRDALWLLQTSNEVWDISSATGAQIEGRLGTMRNRTEGPTPVGAPVIHPSEVQRMQQDHCSALIKANPDYTDLFVSHITWSQLETMLKIFKRYVLPWSGSVTTDIAFPSYPGILFSSDDFYTTNTGMVIQETTLTYLGDALYTQYTTPQTVSEWIRNRVANAMSDNGPDWANVFSQHNSGTYNNQFMLVDFKKFTPGKAPAAGDGLLTILEQVPGHIQTADRSGWLNHEAGAQGEQGYWVSYNRPYFPSIYNISGISAMKEAYTEKYGVEVGDWFSWNHTARANIFHRDAPGVVDISDVKTLMRYNDFKHDPLSTQACVLDPGFSAENAIASRNDLNDPSGQYIVGRLGQRDMVATDAKITAYSLMTHNGDDPSTGYAWKSWVEAGPTHDIQPVFEWDTSVFSNVTHLGHPPVFNFTWVEVDMWGGKGDAWLGDV